jgi:hypothetical protein
VIEAALLQPFHKLGPEIIVEGLGVIPARGGFAEVLASADFPALLDKEGYVMVVEARDVSISCHPRK